MEDRPLGLAVYVFGMMVFVIVVGWLIFVLSTLNRLARPTLMER